MNEIEKLKTQLAVKKEMLKIKDEAFEKLLKENKELHNKIDTLENELEWYKQECDDLEMSGDVDE